MILSLLGLSFLSNYGLQTFVFCDNVFYMFSIFYFIMTERFLGFIHYIPVTVETVLNRTATSCYPLNNSFFVIVILFYTIRREQLLKC